MVVEELEDVSEDIEQPVKKARIFSVKDFRQNLKSTSDAIRLQAVNQFLQLCHRDESKDCILEYLENGGNCLEFLRLLENDAVVPQPVILIIVKDILLEISTKYAQYQSSALEACTYFLNTYMTMINKMLGLNSKGKDRRVVLKLLRAIITLSPNLAKDVLIHVNFNPSNLEILTKHTGDDGIRNAFVHFLIAFLVDGYYPTISALLEKRGLLTSIVNGLKYDDAHIVCMVLTALKTHILENPLVSKTVKMKTFSTPVVKDIVNLYNWKGPESYDPKRKRKKIVTVDEHLKSKVNESVHNFLLVLCTSHKFGVIFRDHQLGLGKKSQNGLMYTVLESLERPWEHSYAGDLVTKICKSCPDLTKTMWLNLKPFLEPRTTIKWLNAVNFAKNLVNELQPSCIEFGARELSVYQVAQVTQMLVAPTQILKTIIPENKVFEQKVVEYHVLSLLIDMLKAIGLYVVRSETWFTVKNTQVIKRTLAEHVFRNFPSSLDILTHWGKVDDELYPGFQSHDIIDYANVIFDLLRLYEDICPQLLDGLSIKINLHEMLVRINTTGDNFETKSKPLQVKMVRLFLKCDQGIFLPKNVLFSYVVPSILSYYYDTKDPIAYATLELLLENTGIFESTLEINIWINAVFGLKKYDESIGELFVDMLKITSKKMVDYLSRLTKIKDELNDNTESSNFAEIFESLVDGHKSEVSIFRHVNLSPLIFGLFEYLTANGVCKSVKCYVNFAIVNLLHAQTNPRVLLNIVDCQETDVIYKNVLMYMLSWKNEGDLVVLTERKMQLLSNFSEAFLEGDVDAFIDKFDVGGQGMELMQMSMFYVINLANLNKLSSVHVDNSLKFVKHVWENKLVNVSKSCDVIFGNPQILNHFSCLHVNQQSSQNLCTNFVVEIVKILKGVNLNNLEILLRQFRMKLFASLIKIIKKPSKLRNFNVMEIVDLFDLNYKQCYDLIKQIIALDESSLIMEHSLSITYNILKYSLHRYSNLSKNYVMHVFDGGIIEVLSKRLCYLNNRAEQFDTSSFACSFRMYLELFPHCISYVASDLFKSIITRKEYCKENTSLAVLLIKNSNLSDFAINIDDICLKKGLILSLLEVIDQTETLKLIYDKFEPSITKSLQKPQKAGQHFNNHYKPVGALLNQFLSLENCKVYVDKVHKYETTEIFHTYLLEIIYSKVIFVSENYDEKQLNNCVLTFVHLVGNMFKKKSKNEDDWIKLRGVVDVVDCFVAKILSNESAKMVSYVQVYTNETFKTVCKFLLKFGMSGYGWLLKLLCSFIKFLNMPHDDLNVIMEMVISHSEFLELILNDYSTCKTELLSLIFELFRHNKAMMNRRHVPVVLAAYGATVKASDRIVLCLLKMFESVPDQTNFYDYKPFLWGRTAAHHYSIRSDIQKALWRQPRFGAVLDILDEYLVINTINNYPLDLTLNSTNLLNIVEENIAMNIYDLGFLLPLFAQLLAPENAVQTYRFTKSGALSLTIVGLGNEDRDLRAAACHVLSRFYHHLEARMSGKDNALWLRFVEAICKGTGILDDFKLNNFAAIFLAKMSLILTQPLHVMYLPLSQYLGAKSLLDFNSVPELYTLLHSCDVNYKEHRSFILEILRDGLRSSNDFDVALRSMAFKLIMELYTSSLSDFDTKLLILDVLRSASKIPAGFKMLCTSYGLLSWLHQVVCLAKYSEHAIISRIFDIFSNVPNIKEHKLNCHLIIITLSYIIDNIALYNFKDDILVKMFKIVLLLLDQYPQFITETRLRHLVSFVDSKECEYLLRYGVQYVDFDFNLNTDNDKYYFLKFLTLKWINVCKKCS